jgi:hypothetical protein
MAASRKWRIFWAGDQTGNRRCPKFIGDLGFRREAVYHARRFRVQAKICAWRPASEARRPELERRHRVRYRYIMLSWESLARYLTPTRQDGNRFGADRRTC